MAKKSKKLEELRQSLNGEEKIQNVNELDIRELKILRKSLDNLTDSRCNTSYQELGDIVMIVILSILANCNDFEEIYEFAVLKVEWFKKICVLKYGIPSLSTIKRVFAIIDTKELEEICAKHLKRLIIKINKKLKLSKVQEDGERKIYSYDGKVVKSSARNQSLAGKQKPVNAMTAYDATNDICLKTEYIEKKTNEIPTMLELLEYLNLRGTISTFDALNTQEKTIEKIIFKHGDYVAPIKGNHKLFYEDLKDYFDDAELYKKAKETAYVIVTEKAHNQYEKREYILTDDIEWITEKDKWKKLNSIGICIRTCKAKDGSEIVEKRYYITSLKIDEIEDFKRAIRDEWKIENNLHWQLDYTFKEDYSTTANKNSQQNLNIVRKYCLKLLKLIKPMYNNKSLKKIRFIIGANFENEIEKILNFIDISDF